MEVGEERLYRILVYIRLGRKRWVGGNKQTKATKSLKHVPQQLAFAKLLMDNICILRERECLTDF